MRYLLALLFIGSLATGCDNDRYDRDSSPTGRVGDQIEDTGDEVEDSAEHAGEHVEDAVDND